MIEIRSLRDLLRLFYIYRREFKLAVISTVVIAVLGAYLLPSRYESEARLLIKPGRETTTVPIEAGNRPTYVSPSTQHDPIVDEEKMLTGRPIVHLVAERYLAMKNDNPPEGFWKALKFYFKKAGKAVADAGRGLAVALGIIEEQNELERLASRLEKNFTASHEPGSSVIEISFKWDDPQTAQQILATWVKAYLEQRARVLGRQSLYAFYEGESHKVGQQIGTLKQQLQQRLKTIDSVSAEVRLKNLTNQIERLSDARIKAQNQLAGLASFLASARQQLKAQPALTVTQRETSLNPTQLDLKRQLNVLQVERARLLRTYQPGAAAVHQVEQNIADLQALSAKEQMRVERSYNTAPNSLVVNVSQQIIDAELKEQELKGNIAGYDKALAALRKDRDQVMTDEPELNRLSLQLRTAEKSYALYSESLEQARIDHELDSSQINNIAQIEQATYNPSRVFPKSWLILLFALPAGVAVGLLTIYICYLLDQRIYDAERVQEVFQVPLWSTLPELGNPDTSQHAAFTASLYRLYGLLPTAQIRTQGIALGLTSARHGEGVSFIIERLRQLLEERGYPVKVDSHETPRPGEVLLLDASALLSNKEAFLILRRADLIALVIEARVSTVPMIENAMTLLVTAFKKVDGVILNRRRFEVPTRVLARINHWRGAA